MSQLDVVIRYVGFVAGYSFIALLTYLTWPWIDGWLGGRGTVNPHTGFPRRYVASDESTRAIYSILWPVFWGFILFLAVCLLLMFLVSAAGRLLRSLRRPSC